MALGFRLVTNSLKLSEINVGLKTGDTLCAIDELEVGAAREFSFRSDQNIYDIFIQRSTDNIYAYVNVCPHAGTPLNMDEGRFMEKTGVYLMCHTHGALFQLKDGLCVAGPCNGSKLQKVDIKEENGNILVV